MGSSVRKTSDKIKKILKQTIEDNPDVESKEVIPKVAVETLRSKKTKGYFGDKDFAVLAGGGFACFKKAKEIGIDKFLEEYIPDGNKLTVIEVQKIIEVIIRKIEDDNGEIDSQIILSAFKGAMTKMLLEKIDDPETFLTVFCNIFITMVIREEANEELIEAFKTSTTQEFDSCIEEFSQSYVQQNFGDVISKCNSGEIEIETLIHNMQEQLGKSEA